MSNPVARTQEPAPACQAGAANLSPQSAARRRIAFALLMGIVTTGIISFTILSVNLGLSNAFLEAWLRSWAMGYAIVIPAILVIGPRLQKLVERIVP